MTHYLVLSFLMVCVGILNLWQGRPVDTPLLMSGIYLICHEIRKIHHDK